MAVLLASTLAVTACSTTTSAPTTFGVDGAPQLIQETYLTVVRQAATLAGFDATNDQWLEFAQELCSAGLGATSDLAAFATAKAGPKATPDERQMWTTAATAAATSFCPIG